MASFVALTVTCYRFPSSLRRTAGSWAYTYDAAGNQTKNGLTGQTATYNARGAVTAIGATTYTALGQGNTNQLSRSASSTTNRSFTGTPTGQALGVHGTSTEYYYAQDSLGSVIGLFDKTGTYRGGYSYSPYGEARATGTNTAMTYNHLRGLDPGEWTRVKRRVESLRPVTSIAARSSQA